MYIYELPYKARRDLCVLLDADDAWKDLAGIEMKLNYMAILDINNAKGRSISPTDLLLNKWGLQNHTILELFLLLYNMKHLQAMKILFKYVPGKFAHLLVDDNLKSPVNNAYYNKDSKNVCLSSICKCSQNKSVCDSHNSVEAGIERKSLVSLTEFDSSAQLQWAEKNELEKKVHFFQSDLISKKDDGTSDTQKFGLLNISFNEIISATNNFAEKNIIGRGGFGIVYYGLWNNTPVAVKHNASVSHLNPQHIAEIHALCYYRHENIVSLYGYSVHNNILCLVHQFLCNGSLFDWLRSKKNVSLIWLQRLNIAVGTARGIQFLHLCNPPLIHDQNFQPKIGDFGMVHEASYAPHTHLTVSRVNGTRPYLPPEYLRSKQLSIHADTYSFGVLATGRLSFDPVIKRYLTDIVIEGDYPQLKDISAGPDLLSIFPLFIRVGIHCCQELKVNRPSMVDVFLQLQNHLVSSTVHDIPQFAKLNKSATKCSQTIPNATPKLPIINASNVSPIPLLTELGIKTPLADVKVSEKNYNGSSMQNTISYMDKSSTDE